VRGTLGAACRTVLFVAGMALLFTGIGTYAFPSLGAAVVPATGVEANPNPAASGGGPSTLPSIAAIFLGLLVAAVALAVPGRSSLPLVPYQRYTRRQRATVLCGAALVGVVPTGVFLVVQRIPDVVILFVPAGLLAVLGGLLVLVGTAWGLS
jgi:hypothetical protein